MLNGSFLEEVTAPCVLKGKCVAGRGGSLKGTLGGILSSGGRNIRSIRAYLDEGRGAAGLVSPGLTCQGCQVGFFFFKILFI